MRQRTTTKKLHEAISNNLLTIEKVQCSYKSSNRIDEISRETFKDSLDFLCESGVFADFVDWHYKRNLSEKDGYILDSGAMNPYSENVVTVYLKVNDGVKVKSVDNVLRVIEN